MSDDVDMHGTKTVCEDGFTVTVSIPASAVENSGIEVGEQVMVASEPDGPVVLIPWSEDDIRDRMDG